MRVAVLGAGAWGCALATLLANLGHDVALWEIDAALAARLARTRENHYLGIRLTDSIEVTAGSGDSRSRSRPDRRRDPLGLSYGRRS